MLTFTRTLADWRCGSVLLLLGNILSKRNRLLRILVYLLQVFLARGVECRHGGGYGGDGRRVGGRGPPAGCFADIRGRARVEIPADIQYFLGSLLLFRTSTSTGSSGSIRLPDHPLAPPALRSSTSSLSLTTRSLFLFLSCLHHGPTATTTTIRRLFFQL